MTGPIRKKPVESGSALCQALTLEPQSQNFFFALADAYLKSGQKEQARELAVETTRQFPDHAAVNQLLNYLQR
jgi:thioredoxin-like negative regulator of GroEL